MDLTAEHFESQGITEDDLTLCPDLRDGYAHGDDVRPKFDSVAALILWQWSLDSGQDETSGDAQYGNGWHALFRDERAILHTGNSGFVTAWRVDPDKDLDAEWAEIEKGAVYDSDADNDPVFDVPEYERDAEERESGARPGTPVAEPFFAPDDVPEYERHETE